MCAILCSILNSYAQQDVSFANSLENFIIKQRSLYSTKYADRINKELKEGFEKMKEKPSSGINIPLLPPPKVVASDFKQFIYFTVTSKYYIQYSTVNNVFESDSLIGPAINSIKKIDRESLSVTEFNPSLFTKSTEELHEKHICTYQIEKEYKDAIKYIAGYKCFKVTLFNAINPYYGMEMYVTEDIKLNYHPVMNCKETLNKYFPLYIKIFSKDYPNDHYEEYMFFKSM